MNNYNSTSVIDTSNTRNLGDDIGRRDAKSAFLADALEGFRQSKSLNPSRQRESVQLASAAEIPPATDAANRAREVLAGQVAECANGMRTVFAHGITGAIKTGVRSLEITDPSTHRSRYRSPDEFPQTSPVEQAAKSIVWDELRCKGYTVSAPYIKDLMVPWMEFYDHVEYRSLHYQRLTVSW